MIPAVPRTRPIPAWRASSRQRTPTSLHEDSLQLALERVLACEDAGPALRHRLQRYAPFLAVEFEEEEGPAGLLGELLELDPGLAHRVEALRREHQELLSSLEGLIDLLADEPAESEACWAARRALVKKLRDHRRGEEALLLDAHFQDAGGEG